MKSSGRGWSRCKDPEARGDWYVVGRTESRPGELVALREGKANLSNCFLASEESSCFQHNSLEFLEQIEFLLIQEGLHYRCSRHQYKPLPTKVTKLCSQCLKIFASRNFLTARGTFPRPKRPEVIAHSLKCEEESA